MINCRYRRQNKDAKLAASRSSEKLIKLNINIIEPATSIAAPLYYITFVIQFKAATKKEQTHTWIKRAMQLILPLLIDPRSYYRPVPLHRYCRHL